MHKLKKQPFCVKITQRIFMKRREFITYTSSVTALYLAGCGSSTNSRQGSGMQGGGGNPNNNPDTPSNPLSGSTLPVPPLLKGRSVAGVMQYDLTLKEAEHGFFDGIKTQTYGINGTFLGPTLLLKDGEEVSINVTNPGISSF